MWSSAVRCVFVFLCCFNFEEIRGQDSWSGSNAGQCGFLDTSSPKTPGDNGFHINISGNPQKYVPGENYAVILKGIKTSSSIQKFIGFMFIVDPANPEKGVSPATVGTFQPYDDAVAKFSPDCPNAVMHTSRLPKPEIQVLWTAPPPGAGCVYIKALVLEYPETWYKDDGRLTREFCEEEQDNFDKQPEVLEECCACDEAKYEIVFEGLWNRHTHPNDFPTNEWLTHFSDIIGVSHSPDYTLWEAGGYASEGLQYVAEWGATRNLEQELKAHSSHIRTVITARGLWYPNVNGKTFTAFRVDRRHHLMSLVSMLGPSPDWIVGVSKLELCLQNCSWIGQRVLNLYPWDAGTDSGVTYESPNLQTFPKEKIRQITSSYPNNDKSPFYDPEGKPMKPVAKLTITRQRLYEKQCSDSDFIPETDPDAPDIIEDSRPECAVSDWGPFTPCSVTCGKGLRTRRRVYKMPEKAQMMDCVEQLDQNEMCASKVPVCDDDSEEEQTIVSHRRCGVTPWTPWSECSVTCGKGMRFRSRRYLDPKAQKVCTLNTRETGVCMALAECEGAIQDNGACAVTVWSDWSPCSVTCGKGTKFRIRQYLKPNAEKMCNVETMEKDLCMADKLDCTVSPGEAKEICMQERQEGPCRGHFPRWYFDAGKATCIQFNFGGCRGNRNNFERYEDCNEMCSFLRSPQLLPPTEDEHNSVFDDRSPPRPEPIDCMLSEWSPWSRCSVTCGRGRMERRRMIKVEPQNGGKPCNRKRIQRKRCNLAPCNRFN